MYAPSYLLISVQSMYSYSRRGWHGVLSYTGTWFMVVVGYGSMHSRTRNCMNNHVNNVHGRRLRVESLPLPDLVDRHSRCKIVVENMPTLCNCVRGKRSSVTNRSVFIILIMTYDHPTCPSCPRARHSSDIYEWSASWKIYTLLLMMLQHWSCCYYPAVLFPDALADLVRAATATNCTAYYDTTPFRSTTTATTTTATTPTATTTKTTTTTTTIRWDHNE